MRKQFLLLTLFFFTGFCFAQVSVKLQQPPPNQLRAADLWKLTLNNTTRTTYSIKLEGTLDEAGEGRVATGNSGIISLPPGTKAITYDDVKRGGSVNFRSGKWQEAFTRTGNAPSGDYTICIYVKTEAGDELGRDCIQQTVEILSAPTLISPADGETILEGQTPIFTWLPPTPAPRDVSYSLKIVEVLGNQSPNEAMQRNRAWFEKSDIRTTMLQYPVSARKIEKNKKYAWNVQLIDRNGQGVGENSGKAEPFTFNVEGQNGITKSLPVTNPTDSTSSAGGTGTAAVGDTIRAGLNGEFKVAVAQMTIETDGSLTGKGRVHIPWLLTNVAVEFIKIRIDSTKRLTSGGIVASQSGSTSTSYQTYPIAWALSLSNAPAVTNFVDGTVNWTNHKVDDIVNWVNNDVNVGQPFINYQSNIPPPALPDNSLKMPFGLQFNNGNQKLVITEFLFKPNESKINFLAQEQFTKGGIIYKLGFVGKYFKIHPGSIEFANGRVELAEDFTLPNTSVNPKMRFTFKKGAPATGCYIQWANSGITDIGLGLEVKFTRDWLLPIPTSTDSVKATISGNGTSMQDILLTGNLPNCEIVGTNGLKIQASQISLDLSDIRNPSGIVFPVNYPTTPGVDWQGFYIQSFGLTLPETWKTPASLNPPSVTASNFIIDDMGLTTKIKAVNVFNLQSGRVADLSASLDTIEISIISSSLVSGSAKGKLVLPISDVTAQNSLKYTATFAQAAGANNFQIVIVPYQAIEANILKGKMTLSPTSNITATKSPNVLTLAINLNGTFNWDNPDLSAPIMSTGTSTPTRATGIKGVKMELAFENVGLTYTNNSSADTNTLAFNYGTWSFASPPKWLANFPVTIKKVYYKSLTKETLTSPNMELLRGALMIDIVANLTEDIGGTTTVGAAFAVEFNKSTIKFTPKFKGVFIDSIAVHADLSAVKINGSLAMYDNHPMFGDGFSATLGVTFTAVSLQVDALAQFGNTTYLNNNQYYRYWRVEADVKLPVGIPFLTGVGFYGFGGGAFYNMKANTITSIADPGNTAYTFEPKKSALGFMVKATIGTLPKFETFNADVSLMALFSASGGLTELNFLGNFWLAAKLSERPDAKIIGSVAVTYNFPDKIFFMGAGLIINVPPAITTPTPVGFVMNIDGRSNLWYLKCGIPTATNTVNVFGISLYSYLMFGNDIPTPNGFTPRFSNNYYAATGSSPNNNVGSGGVGINTTTGKGFATGIGIEFSKNIDKHLYEGACRNWSIGGDVMAGAELNLALMYQTGCIGINGYRASGNLGLYASVYATINGINKNNSSGTTLCPNKSINLFKIQVGAWLEGKFPNPEYVAGSLTANINLFNGLCEVPYYQYFEKGTNCYGTEVATTDAAQEDKAGDLKNKLIQYVAPTTQYNFPVASTINVKYALVPNQVFDVAENQGDGTIKNRTFKLVITKSLEVKNVNGTWTLKTLQSKANNIGEWQYYLTVANLPGTSMPAGSVGQASNQQRSVTATSLNTNNGNTLVSSNGRFNLTYIPSPVPPPPPPNYPNPIPNPVNNLVADMEYRFIVTADLKEGITSGNTIIWSTAKTRTNNPVKEIKTVLFRTGGMPAAQVNTTVPRSR